MIALQSCDERIRLSRRRSHIRIDAAVLGLYASQLSGVPLQLSIMSLLASLSLSHNLGGRAIQCADACSGIKAIWPLEAFRGTSC